MTNYERASTISEIQSFYDRYGALRLATLLHTYGVSLPTETISKILEAHEGIPSKGIGSKSFRNGWERVKKDYGSMNPVFTRYTQ